MVLHKRLSERRTYVCLKRIGVVYQDSMLSERVLDTPRDADLRIGQRTVQVKEDRLVSTATAQTCYLPNCSASRLWHNPFRLASRGQVCGPLPLSKVGPPNIEFSCRPESADHATVRRTALIRNRLRIGGQLQRFVLRLLLVILFQISQQVVHLTAQNW